jgi:hypothetical protein
MRPSLRPSGPLPARSSWVGVYLSNSPACQPRRRRGETRSARRRPAPQESTSQPRHAHLQPAHDPNRHQVLIGEKWWTSHPHEWSYRGAMDDGVVVTEDEIAEGLGRLGLDSTSSVLVHASLRSFGRVDGGAEAVCRAARVVPRAHVRSSNLTPVRCPTCRHGSPPV